MRQQLLDWWEVYGRRRIDQKPWMFTPDGRWPDPGEELSAMECWVAEVMLQQTQLQVMLPYWQRWLAALPSLEALAAAAEHDVLMLWQGLGYYSRARRLHQAAGQLLAVHTESRKPNPNLRLSQNLGLSEAPGPYESELWPRSLEGWQALPGLGRSTAASILSSAFDVPEPILDGNVKRVLARLIASPRPPARQLARFWQWSELLLDPRRPRAFNQALMDLGSGVCTPRSPACGACPWQGHCAAYAAGDPARFPVKDAACTVPYQVIGVGVVLDGDGRVLIDQRLNEGLLGGLWEFPGGKQEEGEAIAATIARELVEELAIDVEVGQELIVIEHAYSHKRLRFVVHLCRWLSGEPQPLASQQVRWVRPAELADYPFPAANARIIAALLEHLAHSGAA
ncbi:MAG: 8-oxo-dGTP diphosphatase MutT [Synechococcaceae cyanobacterium ELA739]